ncbi:MAG TPA: Gfo/Idh/MocA family oxidoreductase [Candidatus Acidoferrales bacterium]|nr:Gfo/Idh/MocA family oxidoreductase [Candidatus Acidoferrales bacterium]
MNTSPVNVGVVGYGYWGPNLVRNFMSLPSDAARVKTICDKREDRLAGATRIYPSIATTTDYDGILKDPEIDLIAIATPVASHFPLTEKALHAGKHVLVEKPLAGSVLEAESLVALAHSSGRKLFVDHTFVFTPAVRRMRELVQTGSMGELLYYDSTRINLGIFQHDVDVVWDLVPHDLSILDFLLSGLSPSRVSCTGVAHYGDLADLAYVTLYYPNGFIAHINVNWLAPVKIRQILLCGDKQMMVYDEHTVQEKVRIYDRGVRVTNSEDLYQKLVEYRDGDMFAPKLPNTEALRNEIENVIASIRGKRAEVVDGEAGLRVVRTLEAATRSMNLQGRPVEIELVAAAR